MGFFKDVLFGAAAAGMVADVFDKLTAEEFLTVDKLKRTVREYHYFNKLLVESVSHGSFGYTVVVSLYGRDGNQIGSVEIDCDGVDAEIREGKIIPNF